MAATDSFDPYFDYDDEEQTVLPPRLNADDSHLTSRFTTDSSNTTLPTSSIHIDEEVVVKNKRKPAVRLIDRYPPAHLSSQD